MKIQNFLGLFPKRSAELLPDTAAQVAKNYKLYSGDLTPYPIARTTGYTTRTGGVQTLYAMENPTTGAPVFLSWTVPVNIAVPTVILDEDQRIYYTGDGTPKVTYYSLAAAGPGPYPVGAFRMGLPLPDTVVTATTSAVPTATVSSIARSGNQVTVVTSAAHNLTSGSIVSVVGVPNTFGTYSQSASTMTVSIIAHTLTAGDNVTLQFTTTGSGKPVSGTYKIDSVATNTFVVTVPNSATDSGNVQLLMGGFNVQNVAVTVVNSTTITFPGSGFSLSTKVITGASLTLSSTPVMRNYLYTWVSDWNNEESIGSEPSTEVLMREGQTATITNIPMTAPSGNWDVRGVRLYRTLTGTTTADYLRLKTLWFPAAISSVQRASNIATIQCAVRHKLSVGDRIKLLGITSDASFNGEGFVVSTVPNDYTFTFSQAGSAAGPLLEAAGKLYYDVSQRKTLPAVYMTGTTFTDNFDSRLLFANYTSGNHAPPPTNLEGLVAINDGMLAGFVGNTIYLSEPGKPHAWPSANAKILEHKIVALASVYGTLFVATEKYPYILSGNTPQNMSVTRIDAVLPCVSRRSMVSMNYGAVYATNEGLAVYSPSSGAALITLALFESDTWNAKIAPSTIVAEYYRDQYFASHSTGSFTFAPDQQTGGQLVDMDDKFTAAHYNALTNEFYYTNGTAGLIYEWDNTTQPLQVAQWKSKVMVSKDYRNLGAARVMADFAPGKSVTFRLYADKTLVFTTLVTNNKPFRLPSGYRTDTYEIEVLSDMRVRSVHLAETILGLKEV